MNGTVAIAGAGVLGRVLALELRARGWVVSLWDRGNAFGSQASSHAAAGMLAPYCELETADEAICRLGEASLERWPKILSSLDHPVFFQRSGSLCVAHPGDQDELSHLTERVRHVRPDSMRECHAEQVRELEPELSPKFRHAIYFENEGQIDARQFLSVTYSALREKGVQCFFGEEIIELRAGRIATRERALEPEWVIDCRGLGAKADLPGLRGVRGELITVEAPEVTLHRPIRVMHPRYPLYVVPRANGRYLIGATLIESEDWGGISVRSSLELLSAAFALHPGFAEGRIVESIVQCRPAFVDNLPKIIFKPRLLRINGLYRHGFLASPRISQLTADFLEAGRAVSEDVAIFQEAS